MYSGVPQKAMDYMLIHSLIRRGKGRTVGLFGFRHIEFAKA